MKLFVIDAETRRNILRIAFILLVMWLVSCKKVVPEKKNCDSAKCIVEDVDQSVPKQPVTVH